jgi:nucleolar protein 4
MKRHRNEESAGGDAKAIESVPDAPGPVTKRSKVDGSRSLFVRSLPADATSESLTEFFSQHYPVKHATVVVDRATKSSRGFGFVTLADPDDAEEAREKLDNDLWNGRRIKVEVAEPRHRDGNATLEPRAIALAQEKRQRMEALDDARKPPKLIIRNLPWSIKTSEQLGALFHSFGKVKYADLPQSNGRLRGFGFVTIRGKENAQKAMDMVNGKVLDGRTVAVDWAVEKSVWDQQETQEIQETNGNKEEEEEEAGAADTDNEDTQMSPSNNTRTQNVDEGDDDVENFMRTHFENLEEEESGDEDDEKPDHSDGSSVDEEDTAHSTSHAQRPPRTTDNSSTIFVRNLPFTTTDGDLKTHFSNFGPVRYARVVIDRATDRPAGTGFVCFFNEADSRACVIGAPHAAAGPSVAKNSILQDDRADPEGKYTMDGRLLQVAKAVGKGEAERLTATGGKERREKDKRKLFLLTEGAINRTSSLYDVLGPTEIKVREKSAIQRQKMVQNNPSLHLSLTRLAVRNIPRDMTSKQLKELARGAVVGFAKDVKEGRRQPLSKEELMRGGQEAKDAEHQRKVKRRGVISQAKIVFESREGSKVSEESKAGRSRGYGFIEYVSHRWALMGLRWLNGHQLQDDRGKKQRLIVEFALENAQVIERRRATRGMHEKKEGEEHTKHKPRHGRKGLKWPMRGKQSLKDDSKAPPDPKQALKQTLIARKRLVRKKKAKARRSV